MFPTSRASGIRELRAWLRRYRNDGAYTEGQIAAAEEILADKVDRREFWLKVAAIAATALVGIAGIVVGAALA